MRFFFMGLSLLFSLSVNAKVNAYDIDCDSFKYAINNINAELADDFKINYSCDKVYVNKSFFFGLHKSTTTHYQIKLKNELFPLCKNAEYAATNIIPFSKDIHLGFNDWTLKNLQDVFDDHSIYIDFSIHGGVGGITSVQSHGIQFPDCTNQ